MLAMLLAAQIAVIAHRGEHNHHAENTLPAIQSAIDLGADYVELDVRTTSDGKLVLMHDDSVDRTTDGHGKIRDLTADQIAHLSMKGYPGGVPTFDEALALAHGKIHVYVDWKDATPEAVAHALEAHDMVQNVVVYGGVATLSALEKLEPTVHVMPEADSEEELKETDAILHPVVIAFDEHDFKPAVIDEAKALKADIYVDRLWAQDTPADWQDAIDRGATGIQTNFPGELVEYLRARHLHP
jgi:glycerophosphoryl diester phosphodiesterase